MGFHREKQPLVLHHRLLLKMKAGLLFEDLELDSGPEEKRLELVGQMIQDHGVIITQAMRSTKTKERQPQSRVMN